MRDPLWLDAETMRALGRDAVELIADWLNRPWSATPVVSSLSPEELAARLSEPAPEAAREFPELLARLERDVLPFMARNEHPGYLAYIPGAGTWPSALGDLIASGLNMDVGSWGLAAGPSQLELVVLDWFKQWLGYPAEAAGILTSGGSAANMTALACARESLVGTMSDRLVVYCADQAHSSNARAARILGFRPDQVRVLPVDDHFRMRPDALRAAMDADTRAGREPLFVTAAAGATSTGAVDPLAEIAAICRDRARPMAASLRSRSVVTPRSPVSSSPTRSRSIHTNGSTSRSSAVASWSARVVSSSRHSRSTPTTCAMSPASYRAR